MIRNPDITVCAQPGHELYELPPLPPEFCWLSGELKCPALVCAALNDLNRTEE